MGLILAAVSGYVVVDAHRGDEGAIPPVGRKTDADVCLEEVHYVETKGDRKEWELTATCAQHFVMDGRTLLENITVTFFREEGGIITLTGDRGFIKGNDDIRVEGNVVVTSTDGYRVTSDSLHYDGEKRHISTDDPVRLERQGLCVKGTGVLVDLNEEKVYLHKKVETSIAG
jgi:LPS export ABC transporter protein LptC